MSFQLVRHCWTLMTFLFLLRNFPSNVLYVSPRYTLAALAILDLDNRWPFLLSFLCVSFTHKKLERKRSGGHRNSLWNKRLPSLGILFMWKRFISSSSGIGPIKHPSSIPITGNMLKLLRLYLYLHRKLFAIIYWPISSHVEYQ